MSAEVAARRLVGNLCERTEVSDRREAAVRLLDLVEWAQVAPTRRRSQRGCLIDLRRLSPPIGIAIHRGPREDSTDFPDRTRARRSGSAVRYTQIRAEALIGAGIQSAVAGIRSA